MSRSGSFFSRSSSRSCTPRSLCSAGCALLLQPMMHHYVTSSMATLAAIVLRAMIRLAKYSNTSAVQQCSRARRVQESFETRQAMFYAAQHRPTQCNQTFYKVSNSCSNSSSASANSKAKRVTQHRTVQHTIAAAQQLPDGPELLLQSSFTSCFGMSRSQQLKNW